jgi:hypothetical protein
MGWQLGGVLCFAAVSSSHLASPNCTFISREIRVTKFIVHYFIPQGRPL